VLQLTELVEDEEYQDPYYGLEQGRRLLEEELFYRGKVNIGFI
jgi:hypothetical protein